MVRIGVFSSANDAGLFGDESQMLLAAMAARLDDGKDSIMGARRGIFSRLGRWCRFFGQCRLA
jgi:hypothetical protein